MKPLNEEFSAKQVKIEYVDDKATFRIKDISDTPNIKESEAECVNQEEPRMEVMH